MGAPTCRSTRRVTVYLPAGARSGGRPRGPARGCGCGRRCRSCRWSDGARSSGIAVHSVASLVEVAGRRRPPARGPSRARLAGTAGGCGPSGQRRPSSSAAASRAARSRTRSGPAVSAVSRLTRRSRSVAARSPVPADGERACAQQPTRSPPRPPGRPGRRRRAPARAVGRRRRSAMAATSIGARQAAGRHPRDATGSSTSGCRRAACVAAQCSAIITSTGRASTTCVGRQSVSTSPCASRPRRTAATVPGEPCSRKRRRHGSRPAPRRRCAARGAGTPGSRCTSTPDGEPDQLLLGRAVRGRWRGCRSRGLPPARAGVRRRARGPGEAVASTRSASPGDRAPGRQVEPADQLEVDGVGQRARWLRYAGRGSRSSQADQVVVPPERRWSAQPATASSYDGRRASAAQHPGQAGHRAGSSRRPACRPTRASTCASASMAASATTVGVGAGRGSASGPRRRARPARGRRGHPRRRRRSARMLLQPGRGDLVDRGASSRRHGRQHLVRPLRPGPP